MNELNKNLPLQFPINSNKNQNLVYFVPINAVSKAFLLFYNC